MLKIIFIFAVVSVSADNAILRYLAVGSSCGKKLTDETCYKSFECSSSCCDNLKQTCKSLTSITTAGLCEATYTCPSD